MQVFATALPNLGKYHDDNETINVVLEDGSVGTVIYLANGDRILPKEYIEIFSQGKVAILEDFRQLKLIAGGKQKIMRSSGQDKGHRLEMDAWIDAIRTGKPEPVPFDQAVNTTRATFAALRSLTSGKPELIE